MHRLFEGVERNSNNIFLVPVEKRDMRLFQLIIKNILNQEQIISDTWKGYKDLKKNNL